MTQSVAMQPGREFAGKVAIVTGAARNIGRSIALALAAGGARVAVTTRAAIEQANAVVEEIRGGGGEAAAFTADNAERAQIEAAVDAVLKRFGRIDMLVLNAAVREHGPVTEISYEDWRRILATDLDSAFIYTKACLPALIEAGGGSIVTFAGVTALLGEKGRAHVAVAKHGIVGLTKALANDLAQYGIRVNCVSPGQIDTSRAPGNERPNKVDRIPLGRKGESDEIAATVRFLCGPGASYITGQTWHVNGGLTMY
ncbi:MAG TPA: SDR family oxidoreductase [Burkholderiales bacterium]|nr:SDR family oxidoreductase [Burkholderiales bacterium]